MPSSRQLSQLLKFLTVLELFGGLIFQLFAVSGLAQDSTNNTNLGLTKVPQNQKLFLFYFFI